MSSIRPCGHDEQATILAIVNAAAEAYRGVIPQDFWHEPYMWLGELESEIAARPSCASRVTPKWSIVAWRRMRSIPSMLMSSMPAFSFSKAR